MPLSLTEAAPALVGRSKPSVLLVESGEMTTRVARGDETVDQVIQYDTPPTYERSVDLIAHTARTMFGGRRPDIVSIGAPGSPADGIILETPAPTQTEWLGKPFAKDVQTATYSRAACLSNECVAGAESERHMHPHTSGMFVKADASFGDALWLPSETYSDEPAHRLLRPGRRCDCGADGCINAYVGGASVARITRPAGTLRSKAFWERVGSDMAAAIANTLQYHITERGINPAHVSLTGWVALSSAVLPHIGPSLREQLGRQAPTLRPAVFGHDSVLHGLRFLALEQLERRKGGDGQTKSPER